MADLFTNTEEMLGAAKINHIVHQYRAGDNPLVHLVFRKQIKALAFHFHGHHDPILPSEYHEVACKRRRGIIA